MRVVTGIMGVRLEEIGYEMVKTFTVRRWVWYGIDEKLEKDVEIL